MKRVVVVGAGIMGLCTAWGLIRRGMTVTVLDQGPIPNPLGASFDRHRLIRYPYGPLVGYRALVEEAYPAWSRLFEDLGTDLLVETGTLVVGPASAPWISASIADADASGRRLVPMSRPEVEVLVPGLTLRPGESAWHHPSGGVLLADRIVTELASWCRSHGGTLLEERKVAAVDAATGEVRSSTGETFAADGVVIATGAWTPPPTPPESPVRAFVPSRQVVRLVDVEPSSSTIPMVLGLDDADGFYLVPPVAGTPLKVGTHRFSLRGHPDDGRTPHADESETLRRLVEDRMPRLSPLAFEDRVCHYAVTDDERFRLDHRGRTWRISGFSGHGFKFGAWVGDALAGVVSGESDIEPFVRAFTGHGF